MSMDAVDQALAKLSSATSSSLPTLPFRQKNPSAYADGFFSIIEYYAAKSAEHSVFIQIAS